MVVDLPIPPLPPLHIDEAPYVDISLLTVDIVITAQRVPGRKTDISLFLTIKIKSQFFLSGEKYKALLLWEEDNNSRRFCHQARWDHRADPLEGTYSDFMTCHQFPRVENRPAANDQNRPGTKPKAP